MVTTKETKAKAPPEMSNTRRIATLVIGDALAFLVFAAIGRSSHGEATGLAAIPQIALTAAPFAAAWFIVAPFAGAYRRELGAAKVATRAAVSLAMRTIVVCVCTTFDGGQLGRWRTVDPPLAPPMQLPRNTADTIETLIHL